MSVGKLARDGLLVATFLSGGIGVGVAQSFPQGPCGGLLCDYHLEKGMTQEQIDAADRADPQNCGGVMCDLGMRAFPSQAQREAQARAAVDASAASQAPPAASPAPRKPKRKHVAKAKDLAPAAPAETTTTPPEAPAK